MENFGKQHFSIGRASIKPEFESTNQHFHKEQGKPDSTEYNNLNLKQTTLDNAPNLVDSSKTTVYEVKLAHAVQPAAQAKNAIYVNENNNLNKQLKSDLLNTHYQLGDTKHRLKSENRLKYNNKPVVA